MALVLLSLLALFDWTGSGVAKPIWMFALPLAFGILGGIAAWRRRAVLWAVLSLAFGAWSLPIMLWMGTLILGP